MDFATFLIYTIYAFFVVLLAYISQSCKEKKNRILFTIITYLFVVSFWSFRYGIGFDYDTYILMYYEIKHGYSSSVEPVYFFISKLFAGVDKGEYLVIASMSILTYLFLFQILIKKKILWLGLFFSLVFQYQFMAANQIRQALAISAFLCLLPYIEKRETIKWVIGMLLIAILFHVSTLFILLIIPFSKIKISGKRWCFIIAVLYLLYLFGVFRSFGNILMTSLPLPEKYQLYLTTSRMEAENVGFSFVMLFNVLVALYVAWNYHLKDQRIFTLFMFGVCMYIVFIEYHLLYRLSFYLFYTGIYIVSTFCKYDRNRGRFILIASFLFFLLLCSQPSNLHGVIPYMSLFDYL